VLEKERHQVSTPHFQELNPAATREFAQRYVKDPIVTLSRFGLQSLVDICTHPIFSPHIRSVGFLAITLHIKGLEERTSRVNRYFAHSETHDVDGLVDNLADISEYARLCKEQLQLKASGDREKLLVRALEAIDHPISISITNDLESPVCRGVIGLPSPAYRHDSLGRRVATSSDIDSMMRSWFTSIEKTIVGLSSKNLMSLAGLKINIRRRLQIAGSAWNPDCIEIQAPDDLYSNLTTLHLDLNLEALRCQVSTKSWKDLFKVASKLQELGFTTSCTGVRSIGISTLQRVTKILDVETTFKLKALILEHVPCTLECLLQLLRRHKQTLVRLKLSGVMLLGSWKTCLSYMRKELNLEKLLIYHPRDIARNNVTNRGIYMAKAPAWIVAMNTAYHDFEGQESIHAGLDRMISRI
jgi:hypothetical protein